MRLLKFIFLAIGIGLFAFIVGNINLTEVIKNLELVGFGLFLLLFIYLVAFTIDTLTWVLTLKSIPLSTLWIYRFFQLRLAGEAFNNLTPLAGMGGEPLKAVLLKNRYEVNYPDGVASLILTKSINVLALLIFLAFGFLLILESDKLGNEYKSAAGGGLILLSIGIFLFILVQRFKLTSTLTSRFPKHPIFKWVIILANNIREVEDRLVHFYTKQRKRLILALVFGLVNWILGAVEIFYTMNFIGYPMTIVEAWILESAAQLVRAGVFFIPAGIGIQEGVFVVVSTAIFGSPVPGFTAAIVRRIRELIWIIWGIVTFYFYRTDANTKSFPTAENGRSKQDITF